MNARSVVLVVVLTLATGCGDAAPSSVKSDASVRAARRAYDGAPPTIPHAPMGAACTSCHNDRGMAVAGVGVAPPTPHEFTPGLSLTSRCEQCHVYKRTGEVFAASEFLPLAQDLRRGTRLYPGAPPVMPHAVNMRENCQACHAGPAAREEIRCTHPERARCAQCHVAAVTVAEFER